MKNNDYFHQFEFNTKKGIVEKKWIEKKELELEDVYNILSDFEQKYNYNYKIIYPHSIIENDNLKEVVIGINSIEENEIENLIFAFVDFYKNENLSSVTIISIKNNTALFGFRVSISFFQRIKTYLENGEFQESEFGNPLPIIITNKLLKTLNKKINLVEPDKELGIAFEIIFDIWRLNEYRSRLNINNAIENRWLENIDHEYTNKINQKLLKIKDNIKFIEIENFVMKSLNKKVIYSQYDMI